MRLRTPMVLVLSTVLAVGLLQGPVAGQTPQTVQVDVVDNEFRPGEITVSAGDTVEWVASQANEERHTVSAEDHSFEGDLQAGDAFNHTFARAGTFSYHCDVHPPDMVGTVVVQAVAPGAPRDVAATPGDGSATVTWAPPASDGGSAITGYTVTADPGGAVVDVGGSATSATVGDLTNGTAYTFTVTARNAQHTGEPSAPSEPVTPAEGQPDPDPDACAAAPFTDRASIPETHRGNVDCAAELEIVGGFGDGTYGPTAPVRRDQMASFIARALTAVGVELPAPASSRFSDVAASSPHDDSIHRLAEAGIVEGGAGGLPATSYGPELGVRRDQMASFLLRAAAYATNQELASQTQRFADVGSGNAHFANVNGAFEVGLAQGFDATTYGPSAGVRRDQMGTFVIRLVDYVNGTRG